jgi:hypothetical protein
MANTWNRAHLGLYGGILHAQRVDVLRGLGIHNREAPDTCGVGNRSEVIAVPDPSGLASSRGAVP